MPFGISSAPKVFQRCIHQLIEGLQGMEVVVDDFVMVGYGESQATTISKEKPLCSAMHPNMALALP